MKLPKYLVTVTPLSKTIALVMFTLFPVIAFCFGIQYQKAKDQIDKYDKTQQYQNSNSPSPILINNQKNYFYKCDLVADCIIVKADACGCTAGGKATAINRNYVGEWNNQFPKRMCPAVTSNDPTCLGLVPKCVQNNCKLLKE